MSLPTEYREWLRVNVKGFSGIDERLDYANLLLTKIVQLLGGGLVVPPPPPTPPSSPPVIVSTPNLPLVVFGQRVVSEASVAVQLPSLAIPDGFPIAIKALETNVDTIYIGGSKDEAENEKTALPLSPGDTVSYNISNLSILWIQSGTAQDGVVWTVEQKEFRG